MSLVRIAARGVPQSVVMSGMKGVWRWEQADMTNWMEWDTTCHLDLDRAGVSYYSISVRDSKYEWCNMSFKHS